MSKQKIIAITVGVIVTIAVVVVMAVVLLSASKPTEYMVENGSLEILGSYGAKIDNLKEADISYHTELSLLTQIRNNGSATKTLLKGDYNVTENGKAINNVYLNMHIPTKAFIRIVHNGKHYYFNTEGVDATKALYDKLMSAKK